MQPPEPLDAWTHGGPWSGAIVDGVLYGRGATDNKSGVLAFNKAAKAFLQVRGEVPVNLKLFIEGEEEIGSPIWRRGPRPTRLCSKPTACTASTARWRPAPPSPDVSLGLKSVLFVELIARGAKTDIHSLNFPLVPAPVWELDLGAQHHLRAAIAAS